MRKQLFFCLASISLSFVASAQSWNVTGNAATSTNFLGTTNAVPLRLYTKWVERLRIDTLGNVGIGTASPVSKLQIVDMMNAGGGYYKPLRIYNPNLLTGEHVQLAFGKANSSYNQGEVNFNLAGGAGSVNNTLSFGLYGNPTILTLQGTGSVGIGTNAPDGSAILDMRSTTKGLLIPHMTSAQKNAIASPANGLFIYQTDGVIGFYYYNTGWKGVTPSTTGLANLALSNLSVKTAVNTNLLPDSTGIRNLGNDTNGWKNVYMYGDIYIGGSRFIKKDSFSNTFVGELTGISTQPTSDIGTGNSGFGGAALYNNTYGFANTAIGNSSMYNNIDGSNNTAIGTASLYANTSGYGNTGLGVEALFYNTTNSFNTAIGFRSGENTHDPNASTFLGAHANAQSSLSNVTAVGNEAYGTASNQVVLGNTSVTSIISTGNYMTTSDGRFKRDIKWDVPGLEFINALKPVTYHYNIHNLNAHIKESNSKYVTNRYKESGNNKKETSAKIWQEQAIQAKESIKYSGFVAQEVEEAAKKVNYDFSGIHKPTGSKDVYGLSYAEFVVPLVKAVQELSKKNEEQQKQIDDLKEMVLKLTGAQSVTNNTTLSLSSAYLEQSTPNPSNGSAIIRYYVPSGAGSAKLVFTDIKGSILKSVTLSKGKGQITTSNNSLAAGAYTYTLYLNNAQVDSKQMIVAR